jgi:hypothetical protein
MLGPGAGTGVLQGIQQSKQRQREQDALQQRQQQELWRQQEQVYRYQQQQYEQEAQRRQQTLQQNVAALQKSVPTLKTKADYDKTIETFAVGLQQMGLRVDGNTLRRMVPYVAPDGTKQAGEAFERWLKNPLNKKRMESSPDLAAKDIVPFDRDGDGVPENVTIGEIVKLAGMGVVEGQAVPGMSDGLKANADGILQTLMQQAQAEGKRITPELQIDLQKKAIRMAKEAGDLPNAPKEPRLVQVSRTDEETGEIVTELVPAVPGELSRKPKPTKDPNQAQFTAGTYAGRMEQAEAQLGKLENTISGMNYGRFTVEGRLPAAAQSGAMQSYDQASRNFINAVLRRESGAVISPSEFAEARKQYLPQPGDTPDTIAQKRANRAYVIQQMKRAAGPAYEAPVAPPASGGGTTLTVGRFVVEQE